MDAHSVDNHPDNNISHLPEDSPEDGYVQGVGMLKNRAYDYMSYGGRTMAEQRKSQADESSKISDSVPRKR